MQSTPNINCSAPSQVGYVSMNRVLLSTLLCLLLLAGCPRPEAGSEDKSVARPLEGLKLRLAVVDDPALAAALLRIRGEWNAQTGAELQVEQATEKDLAQAKILQADVVLCPSHLLGGLAERELLASVPPRILRDPEWGGIFELLKLREAAWGKRIMAVPFGSPVLTCYYRADLLERLGRRPPRTWAEYQDLAKLLAAEKPQNCPLPLGEGHGVSDWCGTIEPLGPGWAGLVLMARAAPLAKHRDNYSTLFNIETMEPMVAGPPFVQALEELGVAAKLGPADPFRYDPAAVRTAFWRGECGMALTWPSASDKAEKTQLDKNIRVGFTELPGSRQVFNLSGHLWDTRAEDDDLRVPLLAVAGRLGVVNAKSAHADAAFQLLLWLSDSRMSPQLSAASPATTLFRQSNLKSPSQWVEKPVSALAAAQYGEATEAALRHEQWLGALRLPGRAEYLAALDEAVTAAVRGDKSALDVLLQADKKWREITARLGIERQRAAYRHSLGLE
jgi:ABC-type glycerol-3-phosphate transport system substrate-binding protein